MSFFSRRGGRRRSGLDQRLALPPMSRRLRLFSLAVFFLLTVTVTYFLAANPLSLASLSAAEAGNAAHPSTVGAGEPAVLYQCPMHPEVLEAEPGTCPICGMTLMPVTGSAAAGVIVIDPVHVQNTGVVSEMARSENIARSSRTVGILDYNAENITWINTKFEGWIEKVHVNYVGQSVAAGQPLFEIYSPELVTTQEEFLRALDYQSSLLESGRDDVRRQAEGLVQAARQRLQYWDISQGQIDELERSRTVERLITIFSPVSGVVAEIMEQALEGMYVRRGMDLYKIADLSSVWVHADIYESDLPWIRTGQPAVVSFRHDADRLYRGSILFLYPEVAKETRTLKICVEVPNPQGLLRPGMYADVTVEGPPVHDAVVISRSAVLRTGERDLVFVDLGGGRFRPQEIVLGVRGAGGKVQVISGLQAGQDVVTQAQFMLDSESRLQEAIAKFASRSQATGADLLPQPPPHQH